MANWQGRTEEIADLKQWLNNPNIPLIGIEGIGGTGKSMLAAKIYEDETIENFPKRFWADVSYGAIFTDVATQVLTAFGFPVPEQEALLIQTLVKCLKSNTYLLIIDNLETLLATDRIWASQFYQEFFTNWVEFADKSKVIVTTRERPELPKRFEWLQLSGLKIADGIALLTSLGIQGNLEELEEFVKLVDGYPLLLQFVADLLKAEYPQDPDLKRLASLGLGNLQQLLTDKKVVGQHKLENVGMVLVLDASFDRLNDCQKSLLQNISVYRGVVNAKAAMAVYPGISETEIETELRNLVRRSFLSEKLIDDGRWFEFQPVVLEYVRYKAGNQTETHQQAINYYRSIAKQSGWQTKDDIKEYLEIFYHFYQLADYDSAFEAIRHCHDFLTLRGYYANQVELYGQLVSKWAEIGDTENWNYRASLISLGNAYDSLGQYQTAIDFYQQSLKITREIGDVRGESISLNNLGNAYYSLGQYQTAIDFYQQSLKIKREIGDVRGEANAWFNLGLVLEKVDREADALGAYRNACGLYGTMGLDADVQNCNDAINRLSQPEKPVVSRRGFWRWLGRLWGWVRRWFKR
ncbi:MAG: tetratricopeptide repeat protein [Dolichospermum sp.]